MRSGILVYMKYKYPIALGILVFIMGVFASSYLDWYFLFPHIDKVFHFAGGFALGWFFYVYFSLGSAPMSTFKKFLVIVTSTCFVAVLWEYAERLSSLYSPQYVPWLYHWFQGGDLDDTLLDILAGMSGSFLFSLIYLL